MARRAKSRTKAAAVDAGIKANSPAHSQARTPVAPVALALASPHEAAGSGRRLRGWTPAGSGPNRANAGAATLRNRARDAGRNDWAGGAIPQRRRRPRNRGAALPPRPASAGFHTRCARS